MGRLANSATAAQALVELQRVSVELRSVFTGYSPTFGNHATVRPIREALVGIGLLLGVAGAIALTRILGSRLYQIDPTSPLALGMVAVVLCMVGVLAAYFPSRRASRSDPADVLRGD